MSKFYVQYISGISRQPVPKPLNVSVERDGIKIFKQLIRWQDMANVAVNNSVGNNGFSVGRAIAGDMLAGGIGALAGGMSGKAKFNTFVQITYKSGSGTSELVLMPKGNTKIQEKFINALMDSYGKAPAPLRSFREDIRAINQKGKEDRKKAREQAHQARQVQKQQAHERNERQREQLKKLAAAPSKLLAKLRHK